jgi:hypothetical protein
LSELSSLLRDDFWASWAACRGRVFGSREVVPTGAYWVIPGRTFSKKEVNSEQAVQQPTKGNSAGRTRELEKKIDGSYSKS